MKLQWAAVLERAQFFIQLEAFVLMWFLLAFGFLFYQIFLKAISLKRHGNLKARFKSCLRVAVTSSIFSLLHWNISVNADSLLSLRFNTYSAFLSLAFGAVAVIKLAQILAYLYLFFKNIQQGIPRLIVNLFTVIFSLFVFGYIASEVFSVQVTAMLATSAVFSLVLGLALQDTLGNLFSGVAMQIGQPFKIGDWVEITADSKKWMGQIQEITWRAAFLSSFSEEWIMIPNKTMAQSQIVILSNNQRTLRHSQLLRFDFDADINEVKRIIMNCLLEMPDILQDPAPRVLLIETTESWLAVKVFYSIRDFSLKYRVADEVLVNIMGHLKEQGIHLATNRLHLGNREVTTVAKS